MSNSPNKLTLPSSMRPGIAGVRYSRAWQTTTLASWAWAFNKLWNTWMGTWNHTLLWQFFKSCYCMFCKRQKKKILQQKWWNSINSLYAPSWSFWGFLVIFFFSYKISNKGSFDTNVLKTMTELFYFYFCNRLITSIQSIQPIMFKPPLLSCYGI